MFTWIIAHVRDSKLGASQIWWLRELVLFNFSIHYRTGRSNRAANALSRHPHTEEEIDRERCSDFNEVEVISQKGKHNQSAVQYSK